jgi:hypothetical protein
MRTPFPRREAGSAINRTVTSHTNRVPGVPAQAAPLCFCLLLSTTTELFIIDPVAQHDHKRIPSLRATATGAFPKPFCTNLRR